MSKMIIEFWGDTNCPFCYIGDVVLREAIAKIPYKDELRVHYHACQLHPEMKPGEQFYFREKLEEDPEMTSEKIDKKISVLKHLADKFNLEFGMDNAVVSYSKDALRLLKWITDISEGDPKTVLALAEAFGEAFFTKGEDLGKENVLLDCVLNAGLDATEAKTVLNSDRYVAEVAQDNKDAMEKCPVFVPTLYFNGGHRIEGVLKVEQVVAGIEAGYKEFKK